MAKGWKTLETVNDTPKSNKTQQEKNRDRTRADNFIRSVKSLSEDELKKEAKLLYEQQQSANEALLDAFENKRLKSKNLIKQAIKLKKDKEKTEAEVKAKEAQKENPQPTPANEAGKVA